MAPPDEKLSALDLAAVCNLTEQEAKDIIAEYDPDGDGMLEMEEFQDLKQQILSQQQMTSAPSTTSSRRVTAKEFAVACDITEEDAVDVIRQYDEDGDGTLDVQDFEELKAQVMAQKNAMNTECTAPDENESAEIGINDQQSDREEVEQIDSTQTVSSDIDTISKSVATKSTEAPQSNTKSEPKHDPISSGLPTAKTVSTQSPNRVNPVSSVSASMGLPAAKPIQMPSKEQEQEQLERMRKIQLDRLQRQQIQQQQYDQFAAGKPLSEKQRNKLNSSDDEDDSDDGNEGGSTFKHKWNFGMNFDPKTKSVVLLVSDAITDKKWGVSLSESDFSGPIRQEYRKLGTTLQGGTITYEYPPNGGDLGVVIDGANGEKYTYTLPQQIRDARLCFVQS